jgi:hypothetical protein
MREHPLMQLHSLLPALGHQGIVVNFFQHRESGLVAEFLLK